MTDLAPDELRHMARHARALPETVRLDPDEIETAADAWEAEQKQALLTLRAYNMKCADYAASEQARQRAEKALRQIATMKNDMSADGQFTAGDAYYAQALAVAALAGEEKP